MIKLPYRPDERLESHVTAVIASSDMTGEVASAPPLVEGLSLDVMASFALVLPQS